MNEQRGVPDLIEMLDKVTRVLRKQDEILTDVRDIVAHTAAESDAGKLLDSILDRVVEGREAVSDIIRFGY